MNNVNLYNKINSLPENLNKEVLDFVEFLQAKNKNSRVKSLGHWGA